MSKKKTFELILKTSGFDMKNYELIRDGSCNVGYEFEGWKNGKCEIRISTDSYECAIADLLEEIYNIEGVTFWPASSIKDDKPN